MKNHKKKIAAAIVALVVLAFVAYQQMHQQIILDRFPDLDPTIAKAAYKKILKDAYAGRLADVDTSDEEAMDSLFLARYNEMSTK